MIQLGFFLFLTINYLHAGDPVDMASSTSHQMAPANLPTSDLGACQALAKKRPDLKDSLQTDKAQPKQSLSLRERAKKCISSVKDSWSDTLKELIIDPYNFLSKTSPEATKRYLDDCNRHVECKVRLYYEAQGYSPSGRQLQYLQSSLSFAEMDILNRNANSRMNSSYEQNLRFRQQIENRKWVNNQSADLKVATDPAQEGSSFWVNLSEKLKEEGTKWWCLKPDVAQEYLCYDIAQIIDPTIALGIAAKVPKIMKLVRGASAIAALDHEATVAKSVGQIQSLAVDSSNAISVGFQPTKGTFTKAVAKTHVSLAAQTETVGRIRMDPSATGLTKTAADAASAPVQIQIGASSELREKIANTMKQMDGKKAYSCVDGVCQALEKNGFSIPGYTGRPQVFSSHQQIFDAFKSGNITYQGQKIPADSIRMVASSEDEASRFLASKGDKARFIVVPVAYASGWAYVIYEAKSYTFGNQ
jgi:hypothetical protein